MRSGCHHVRASIPVGPAPFAVAVTDGTVYVADLGAPTVAVIDSRACNAEVVTGCGRRPATVSVGRYPGGIAVNARTDTIYVTGQASNDVSVIDGRTCNGKVRSGCRVPPSRIAAGVGARGIAVDEVTDTVYVANTAANTISVIDGSTCNASRALRLQPGRRGRAGRHQPTPRRRRRGDEHGLRHERGLELGHDAEWTHLRRRVHTGCPGKRIA